MAAVLSEGLRILSGALGVCALTLMLGFFMRLAQVLWKRTRLSCFSCPPQRNWFMGHMGIIRSDEVGLQELDELIRTYHHSCAWFLGPFYNLVRCFHPDYIKPLLFVSASITVKDELFYGFMRPWLGQGLLLSNGKQWSRQRRLLTPAFHSDILKNYIQIFNSSTNTMHEKWRRMLAEGKNDFDMFKHVSLMTLDSLLKCTFSYDSHCQENFSEYISVICELSDLVVKRQRYLPHHWDWLYKRSADGQLFPIGPAISSTASLIVSYKNAVPSSSIRDGQKAPHKLDENGEGLSNEEIKAQANTFMFAGHDTTASAISWVLYNLAMHQEYQDRCRSEINDLLEGRDTDEIAWEDLSNLTFTTMCIKESLRLHPPVLALTRYYSQDINVPEGRTVPEGTICLISVYGTHHNPDVWPNPEVYDPMRFDPDNHKQRNPYAFIPFSAGPRNCIGQNFAMAEIRVVLALTLRRFRLLPGSRSPNRLYMLTLRTEEGLPLMLEPLSLLQS
ncbi:hypothetical protein QTP86_033823 [Hemibagrus guttatus]|nr:hypothetical protein QTP86_033823 [Hemibagrus guttatus]